MTLKEALETLISDAEWNGDTPIRVDWYRNDRPWPYDDYYAEEVPMTEEWAVVSSHGFTADDVMSMQHKHGSWDDNEDPEVSDLIWNSHMKANRFIDNRDWFKQHKRTCKIAMFKHIKRDIADRDFLKYYNWDDEKGWVPVENWKLIKVYP